MSVGTTGRLLMFRKASNFHFEVESRYMIVASKQGIIGRQNAWGFGELAQVIPRNANPNLHKHNDPTAKLVGVDLLDNVVHEIAEINSGGRRSRQQQRRYEKNFEKKIG